MPARDTQFVQGGFYHLYNRGAGKQPIFLARDHYLFVLRRIKQYTLEYRITMIAYCLMPNHYHWLVRQDGDTPAGRLPQLVFNSYTKALNRERERTGTLFEGRYQAKQITDDMHFRHLCRYIHANPAKDGLVEDPERWPYSNLPEWLGVRQGSLVDRVLVTALFPQPEAYRRFVQDYLDFRRLPDALANDLSRLETR